MRTLFMQSGGEVESDPLKNPFASRFDMNGIYPCAKPLRPLRLCVQNGLTQRRRGRGEARRRGRGEAKQTSLSKLPYLIIPANAWMTQDKRPYRRSAPLRRVPLLIFCVSLCAPNRRTTQYAGPTSPADLL